MMKFLQKFSHKKELRELKKSIDELSLSIRALQTASITSVSPNVSAVVKPTGIAVAVVGTRGHGQKHIAAFMKQKDCYIHTICDVDTAVGKAAVDAIEKATGFRPKQVSDLNDVLADKSVEAVSISTPHHWHALATVRALQAGKHVYIEKPITHSFAEGPVVLAAAEKYGKVVQAGTQLRSNTSLRAAGEYMRAGKLGEIELVHCIVHKDRPQVPLSNSNKIPKTVDYDLWCGPADMDAVTRSKFHYHWHWLWRLGNGALGNNGIHRIDAARIALDLKGYGDLTASFGAFKEKKRFEGKQLNHYVDFLNAIKKKDPSAVRGELSEAILSGDLCHFGNISYRVGTPGKFEDARKALAGLDVPKRVFDRLNALSENLDQNGVAQDIVIGETLYHSDNSDAPILNNPKAQELLSTPYRDGYVLPDKDSV